MRVFVLVIVFLVLGAVGYALYKDPAGCQKLGADVVADTTAIVATIKPPYLAPTSSAPPSPVTPATPPVVAPSAPAPASPSTSTAAPVQYPMGYVATPNAPAPVAVTPAAPTPTTLALPGDFTDYDRAVAAARQYNVPMLILFTGSDWCPYCQKLEQEVLSTPDFTKYTSSHFIFLTIDDLRNSPVTDDDKTRITKLEQQFHITGFPTLLVVGTNGQEKGRDEGYDPGSGPAAVISQLDQIAAR